ncbi:MAG: MarR family transcriptional regulator [Deltaproteobacteria bacterium]|nr:MarR family transcriptional regulator [Deltaproteobacteria bacterium]
MSFYKEHGELVFGTRLRRISERFLADVSRVYKTLNIPFETSWFPIFFLLNQKGVLSVSEMAADLEITHSGVSQMVATLEAKNLVSFLSDRNDRRRRLIAFTQQGQELMETLKPIWKTIRRETEKLLAERENSSYLTVALQELEESMENKSIYERVMSALRGYQVGQVDIIPFDPSLKYEYRDLIVHWLIESGEAEIGDEDLINHPDKITEAGKAVIFLARVERVYAGVIAAEIDIQGESKIAFFIVDEKWRGRQIGRRLLSQLAEQLHARRVRKVSVMFDRRFTHAVKLFKDVGFTLQSVVPRENVTGNKNITLLMERYLE